MSKAAELAKWGEVSTNGQVSGRRNIVYNGAMKVAQRGTSVTGIGATAGYFTCDRWVYSVAGSHAGRFTMTQTADGPSGFASCLKLDCTTADTSIAAGELAIIRQHFEGQDLQQIKKGTSDAEKVTVSFYVKASAAFTFGLELFDSDNDRQITKLFSTTTDWVRHEITFPADTTGAFTNDTARSLDLSFWIHAGTTYTGGTLNTTAFASTTTANRAAGIDSFFSSTDNNFFLTGVQMEVGSVATPFEHRSFGEEKLLCGRYYQKKGEEQVHSVLGHGYNNTTDDAIIFVPLTPEMRAIPTLDTGTLSKIRVTDQDASTEAIGALSISTTDSRTGMASLNAINITSDTQTAGEATALVCNNDAAGYIAFIAEL